MNIQALNFVTDRFVSLKFLALFLAAGAFHAAGAGQGSAQSAEAAGAQSTVDYCVRCAAPQATHVCSVSVESEVVSISEWQAFCASQIAFDAGHGQCQATPGLAGCVADQRFSYNSAGGNGNVATQSVPGQPGPRPGGMFDGAADYVLKTGESVGEALNESAGAVGQTVRDGAQSVGETASEVGRGVMQGAREVGDGVVRGVGCVFTLGRQC